jgi:hypothetical protein
MDVTLSGMIDHPRPDLYNPQDDRTYEWLALAPECGVPNAFKYGNDAMAVSEDNLAEKKP